MHTRRLILIDIENFNGGPVQTPAQAKWCRRALGHWLNIHNDEQVIIAADSTTLTNVFAGWPRCRLLEGRGENGADMRLLEVMDENLHNKYTELILVSGDRIYAEKISQLAGQGLPTTVYSHQAALSKRLAFAATTVITSATTTTTTVIRKAA